ncbi:toll/interleukin-1 receptor domain-containing protein [Aequorivita lipolytica]|uniref:TIR domain-containing protein n=1 Tax=Aequorivita lipolytica TaxID=153267 RepID=A0A5C6YM35_9FLAO|nr:toll/interleukin-1 receptor domain-containing protein [Aequorivita lipolytica]TXD68440.1 TIR domain-containing protein [Aequorivita lipolytica]SRX51414.1 hypothetical protein AEQU2_01897 [Aequorivita lipolytica]
MVQGTIFFSYSRDDSEFVLKLAKDLRVAGATIWLDQLDIKPGSRWDSSIEKALQESSTLLVILSCSSVKSNNVLDEVSYALEEHKNVVPVLLEDCEIPFRLRRLQYADFSGNRETGLKTLVDALQLEKEVAKKLVEREEEHLKSSPTPAPLTPKSRPVQPQQPIHPTRPPQPQVPYKKQNFTTYYILGGCFLFVLIAIFIFMMMVYYYSDESGYYDY